MDWLHVLVLVTVGFAGYQAGSADALDWCAATITQHVERVEMIITEGNDP